MKGVNLILEFFIENKA